MSDWGIVKFGGVSGVSNLPRFYSSELSSDLVANHAIQWNHKRRSGYYLIAFRERHLTQVFLPSWRLLGVNLWPPLTRHMKRLIIRMCRLR
jgi:hypothetical protein